MPFPQHPWAPVLASINPVLSATPASAPDKVTLATPHVLKLGLEVMPYGLFPSASLGALVRVKCVFNKPTFWGTRPLSAAELANLWDVLYLAK